MKTVHLEDLGYTIEARPYDGASDECHVVDFKVYTTFWMTDVKTGAKIVCYQKNGSPSSPDPVDSIEDAQVYISGAVKWDGCSDFHFEDEPFHFCSKRQAAEIGVLLSKVYEVAHEILTRPDWD